MNIQSATALALGHGVAVGLISTALGQAIRLLLFRGKRAPWIVLLLPLLTPALVVGYAYSNSSLAAVGVRRPLVNELLYVFLLILRFTPIAAGILYFAPAPPMSRAARHLARRAGRMPHGGAWLGPLRNWAISFAVVFLLVFAEFDLADLMQIKTWAVWLMNAQAGGWALRDSLYYAAIPVLCQLAVLFGVLGWCWRSAPAGAQHPPVAPRGFCWRAIVWCYLIVAAGAASLVPAWAVLHGAVGGFEALWGNRTVIKDIVTTLLYAVAAASGAAAIAGLLLRRRRVLPLLVACLPGLAGSLLLGLVVLAASVRSKWYDTPVPLWVALVLLGLPVAVLAGVLSTATADHEALFVAQRLKRSGRGIVWIMRDRARFWAFALLVYLACFDLGATYLLRPSGHNLAMVRMYDLMHYGRSAVLSATVLTTVGAIAMVLLLARLLVGTLGRVFHP